MNIVFLDIDGVIQPYNSKERYNHINSKTIEYLSNIYKTDYSIYNIYDVCAAYYDWDKKALILLKNILEQTESKIIISSAWRDEKRPNKMKDLLKLHDLDKHWYCDNILIREFIPQPKKRALEIENSLNTYSIDNFVILDDMPGMNDYFPNNTIETNNYLTIEDAKKCIKILKKNYK